MKRGKGFKLIFISILVCMMSVTIIWANEDPTTYHKGVVESVHLIAENGYGDDLIEASYWVSVLITRGDKKGQILEMEHHISSSDAFAMHLEVGDRVIVGYFEDDEGYQEIFINDLQRDHQVLLITLIFIAAIIWVGRWQGVKTILTLVVTVGSIWYIHLPLLLKGVNPILTTIVISLFVTTVTILFLTGRTKKSLAAIMGTLAGVVIAGILAFVIGTAAQLTGLSNEEAVMLKYIPQGDIFSPRALLFSGILLGALGAVMDVAMSISSAIEEIVQHNPRISFWKLYRSGMNIGRDVMGTMTNTLILAYTGSAMPLLLLFMGNGIPMIRIMNFDIIVSEIVRSLAGSTGIVLCIPFTALIAAWLLHDKHHVDEMK